MYSKRVTEFSIFGIKSIIEKSLTQKSPINLAQFAIELGYD